MKKLLALAFAAFALASCNDATEQRTTRSGQEVELTTEQARAFDAGQTVEVHYYDYNAVFSTCTDGRAICATSHHKANKKAIY